MDVYRKEVMPITGVYDCDLKIHMHAEWHNIFVRHNKLDPETTRCVGYWPNTGLPRIKGSKAYWDEMNKFNTLMGYKHVKWADRPKK